MKIYLSVDMEGISSIVSPNQISPGGSEYQRAVKIMTKEVNQVIKAAFDNGAQEVVVNDAHDAGTNIIAEELHPYASLIRGQYNPLSMMQGIDETFDAVFLVGYHARAGTSGAVFDHTYAFRMSDVRINGKPMGEMGINGRVAGYFNVPVAFVSGDQATIKSAAEELGGPVGVILKNAIGRYAAEILPAKVVEDRLTAGVSQAMSVLKQLPPTKVEGEVRLEVTFTVAEMAQVCSAIPGCFLKDCRTVAHIGDDYLAVFKIFLLMLRLSDGIK